MHIPHVTPATLAGCRVGIQAAPGIGDFKAYAADFEAYAQDLSINSVRSGVHRIDGALGCGRALIDAAFTRWPTGRSVQNYPLDSKRQTAILSLSSRNAMQATAYIHLFHEITLAK